MLPVTSSPIRSLCVLVPQVAERSEKLIVQGLQHVPQVVLYGCKLPPPLPLYCGIKYSRHQKQDQDQVGFATDIRHILGYHEDIVGCARFSVVCLPGAVSDGGDRMQDAWPLPAVFRVDMPADVPVIAPASIGEGGPVGVVIRRLAHPARAEVGRAGMPPFRSGGVGLLLDLGLLFGVAGVTAPPALLVAVVEDVTMACTPGQLTRHVGTGFLVLAQLVGDFLIRRGVGIPSPLQQAFKTERYRQRQQNYGGQCDERDSPSVHSFVDNRTVPLKM